MRLIKVRGAYLNRMLQTASGEAVTQVIASGRWNARGAGMEHCACLRGRGHDEPGGVGVEDYGFTIIRVAEYAARHDLRETGHDLPIYIREDSGKTSPISAPEVLQP